jgi:hypothetical protein
MLTQLKIQDFLSKATKGEVTLPLSSINNFGESCKDALSKQFVSEPRKFRIRMSQLGKPICQQLLEKQGYEEDRDYNAIFRFLYGDITESIIMFILEEAGIKVVKSQEEVSLTIGDMVVKGTLDVIIEDELGDKKVWDIKSASEWAFTYKYTGIGGYDRIKEDDPFGYIMQGHLYAEAKNMPFGGWIVVNKSSGEIAVVEAPEWQEQDRKDCLKKAAENIKILTNPKTKFKVPFKDEWETYKVNGELIKTGNKIVPKPCSMCGFKYHCWSKAVLHPKITSKAKNPPQVWYSKLNKKEI